jgi:RNA polymerase sigma-70 factor (ECF subfamily)
VVAAARTGDEAAWARLFQLHAGRLVVWLRWLPMSDAACSAEDIAAQPWLTAASKIHEFGGTDDGFGGWLFGIARGHARNHYRKELRRRTRPTDLEEAGDSAFEAAPDDFARVEGHEVVQRLLAQLSPREAEVLACTDVVGLDIRSTATALGMRPNAVRVARHRALARLRSLSHEREGVFSTLQVSM